MPVVCAVGHSHQHRLRGRLHDGCEERCMLSSERAAIEGGGGGGAPATAPPRMLLRWLLLLAVLGALPLRIPHISEPALLPRLLVLQVVVVHLLLHRLSLHRVPLGLRVGRPTTHFLPTVAILLIRRNGVCAESVWSPQRREPSASHARHASPA